MSSRAGAPTATALPSSVAVTPTPGAEVKSHVSGMLNGLPEIANSLGAEGAAFFEGQM
ncbi:hypothetical protein ACWCXE_00380 [Streptomyces sp. NPDC001780]|uniref:hypothetical protein n=1 Tax=Streptomyces hebeiensis TaxID=229486 RepID=UPI0031D7019C